MPLPSAIKLFIDPRTGDAFGNFAGTTSLTNPVFTLGDTATVELYLVEDTGLNTYPRQEIGFPTSPGVRVAVGAIDEAPLAGTWTLSYGGDTTTALAFNAAPAVVQAALNLLASITAEGGVTVAKIGDNYNILFNAVGARTELTTDGSALIPLSAATVASLQTGDANKPAIYLVHLQRTVAGLATSFSPTAASQITVESLTAWDGTKATYRVSITPDPKGGSFSLSFDAQTGTDVSSAAISVGASALDVQNALSLGALADGKVSVTQVGAYAYDITVKTQPDTAGLTADDAGLLSFAGYKGELNLNTAEAISLLDGAESVQTTLEVEITSDSKTLTVLQVACTLQNAVIDAGAVQPLVLESYLSQTTADGRYFKLSQNLADGTAGTMRTNLFVYSKGEVNTALSLKADVNHTHIIGDVSGLQTSLDGKAAAIHTHIIGDVTGLQSALDGKAALTHTHIIGDITGLSTTLADKASLSGDTFTGKVNFTSVAGAAGLNVGIGGTDTAATAQGDMWIATSGSTLNYRDGLGSWRILAARNLSNTFTVPQIVDTTATNAALRVTQKGTGEAIRVEDSTSPDSTAFVVFADGKTGVGVNTSSQIPIDTKLWVNGDIETTAVLKVGAFISFGAAGKTFTIETDPNTTVYNGGLNASDYPVEIFLRINGNNYAIPARQV